MNKHYHVWASGRSGEEYINCLFENQYDAAFNFLQIVRQLMRYTAAYKTLTVERIANSMNEDDNGMLVFTDAILMRVSGCTGGCMSPKWN